MEALPVNPLSPQIKASAPNKDCPKCGKRMQVLESTHTTHTYVCYNHPVDGPYYLNYHFKFINEDGTIKVKEDNKTK